MTQLKPNRFRKQPLAIFGEIQRDIITKEGSIIGDDPVLVAETLAIHKPLMRAIIDRYPKIIIQNDSLIVVHAINREFNQSKDICNFVQDIIILVKNVDNIQFVFCKITVNELAGRIVRETLHTWKFGSCN